MMLSPSHVPVKMIHGMKGGELGKGRRRRGKGERGGEGEGEEKGRRRRG
jgi:hypothetical protein